VKKTLRNFTVSHTPKSGLKVQDGRTKNDRRVKLIKLIAHAAWVDEKKKFNLLCWSIGHSRKR